MKHKAIRQFLGEVEWGRLDYLVIDSPPGTGDEPMSVAQVAADARAVIVTTPQEVALADVRKAINFCRHVNLAVLGLVENMSGLICPIAAVKSTCSAREAARESQPIKGFHF
jgi:ATP-binding protein involved in chromosome partitioning